MWYKYAEKKDPIQLIFLWATIQAGRERNLQFEQMVWAAPAQLESFDFLEQTGKWSGAWRRS